MPVVSISLNDTLLEKIENLQEDIGFSGRSEVIRTALRNFIEQKEELEDLAGEKTAVLTVKHVNDAGLDIHDFQGLVRSQLHDHDESGDCIQVFVVSGQVEKIVELKESLESESKVNKVSISLA